MDNIHTKFLKELVFMTYGHDLYRTYLDFVKKGGWLDIIIDATGSYDAHTLYEFMERGVRGGNDVFRKDKPNDVLPEWAIGNNTYRNVCGIGETYQIRTNDTTLFRKFIFSLADYFDSENSDINEIKVYDYDRWRYIKES